MSVPSSALRHIGKRYTAYAHQMSAEDDVHRDISGRELQNTVPRDFECIVHCNTIRRFASAASQVPTAKAAATSSVLFGMISIDGSAFKAFDVDISNMKDTNLLKALKHDDIFNTALKDVHLSKSQVWIMKTPSDDEVLASDRSNAMRLKGWTPVKSVVDGLPAASAVMPPALVARSGSEAGSPPSA